MSDSLFGSVLALLGFSSVLPVYFFIHTALFFPVLALVTSGKMQLGYIYLLFPLCYEILHISCFLLLSGHPGLREPLCACSTFYSVLLQVVLIPLWLERKHLPTAFPSRKCGMGNKGQGQVCFPAWDLVVCLHSVLKAELPENHTNCIADRVSFCFLQVYRGEVLL